MFSYKKIRYHYKRQVPDFGREILLINRRSGLFVEAGVVFFHIPKAAGSSINQAIYRQFMGHISARAMDYCLFPKVRKLPRFSVARNPWSRTLSAWRFAHAGIGSGQGVVAAVIDAQKYKEPRFSNFERFVLEWLPQADFSREDGIFRPQFNYVLGRSGSLAVDFVGKVEDLGATERWLADNLGLNVEFPHTNFSGDGIDYRDYYTVEMRDMVAKIYARDIALFDYEF